MLSILPAITSRLIVHPLSILWGFSIYVYHTLPKSQHSMFHLLPEHDSPHPLLQVLSVKTRAEKEAILDSPTLESILKTHEVADLKSSLSDSMEVTKEIIVTILRRILGDLPIPTRQRIFDTVYLLARPATDEKEWGEHHCFDDLERLVAAADCIGDIYRHLFRPSDVLISYTVIFRSSWKAKFISLSCLGRLGRGPSSDIRSQASCLSFSVFILLLGFRNEIAYLPSRGGTIRANGAGFVNGLACDLHGERDIKKERNRKKESILCEREQQEIVLTCFGYRRTTGRARNLTKLFRW